MPKWWRISASWHRPIRWRWIGAIDLVESRAGGVPKLIGNAKLTGTRRSSTFGSDWACDYELVEVE